ncbi:hypothetical protein P7C70_g6165, partial [Phenoliferia sp. Uapishka_3]
MDFDSDDERTMAALLAKKKAAVNRDENQNCHGTPAPKRHPKHKDPTPSSSTKSGNVHTHKKKKRAPLIVKLKKRGSCSKTLVRDNVCTDDERLEMISEVHLAFGIQRVDRAKNWDELPAKVRSFIRLQVADKCPWLDKMDGDWVIDKAGRAYLTNHHKAVYLKNVKSRKARNAERKERRASHRGSDPEVSSDSDMDASYSKKKPSPPSSSSATGSEEESDEDSS